MKKRMITKFSASIKSRLIHSAIAISVIAAVSSPVNAGIDLKFHLDDANLEIWNTSEFQQRFTESYIAETDIEPRVTVDERKDMQEILEMISEDKMEETITKLEKIQEKGGSAVFDFTLANIYFQQEKLYKAAKTYMTAVDKYPKFLRAWKNLGLIYVRQGEFEKAVKTITRSIELGANDSITYGLLGFSYASIGNPMCAESAYRMAILLDPITLDWKMGLARSFFKQQRYEEAIALCDQLIDSNPNSSDLWLLQANAYIGLNQPIKAAEIYELVDALGKSTPESLNLLGDIYINQELYDLAVKSYAAAIDKDPQRKPDRAIQSAKILSVRGAFEQTAALINKVEDVYSDKLDQQTQKDLLKIQARLAVAQGNDGKEAEVLEEIVALDPLDGEALILLGQHCSRNGEMEKAVFYFERAENIDGFEADAKVRHAQLLVKTGKYEDALPLLKRAQQIKPRDNIQQYIEQIERVTRAK
ncbi:MAG: tetratricopeptide repeat protein [Sedimentisphaeraceae bacterium JB056]